MQELLNTIIEQGPEQLKQLLSFILYASKLKNEILLIQSSAQDPKDAPLDLPDSIESFLAAVSNMLPEDVPGCWSAVWKLVWNMEMLDDKAVSIAFQQHGIDMGLRRFILLDYINLGARLTPWLISFTTQLISSIPYVQQFWLYLEPQMTKIADCYPATRCIVHLSRTGSHIFYFLKMSRYLFSRCDCQTVKL